METSTNGLHENGDSVSYHDDKVDGNNRNILKMDEKDKCKIGSVSGSTKSDDIAARDENLKNAEPNIEVHEDLDCFCLLDSNVFLEAAPKAEKPMVETTELQPMSYHSDLQERDNPQSTVSLVEEDVPLIGKEEIIDKDKMLKDNKSGSASRSKTHSPPKRVTHREDMNILRLIHDAEDAFLKSSTSGDKVDREKRKRFRDIATAIYFDDELNLERFITHGPLLPKKEIQRRILEAVELNSLKCLDVLCETYEKNPVSTENDVELFHRRHGLSFWPLDERPKETALHVLSSKHTSIKAIEVLEKTPTFLTDFSDIRDSNGSTPLLLAIKCKNMELVKRLLAAKSDVSKRNQDDESPICVAALNDHADVIREILKTYSETHERSELLEIMKNIDGSGHTILYPASQSGKPEVLNLIMEQDWWEDFLEQEKKTEEWKSFVCYVCAAGCKHLAKIILQQDPILLEPYSNFKSPFISAVKANQEEIVQLIFDIKADRDLFTTCDDNGRNVFHYAVKYPRVLERLLIQFITISEDNEAINKMDDSKNTPIALATVGQMKESFEMLVSYTENEADVFSADLIHDVDIEVLRCKLDIWSTKDGKAVADLLHGDHEEHQPFLEAAKKGNIKLMEFFLQQGANRFQRT